MVNGSSGLKSAVHRMENSTGMGTPEADRVDRPSEPDDAASVDGSFWDVAYMNRTNLTVSQIRFLAAGSCYQARSLSVAHLCCACF
jgi:hypothetical protein